MPILSFPYLEQEFNGQDGGVGRHSFRRFETRRFHLAALVLRDEARRYDFATDGDVVRNVV